MKKSLITLVAILALCLGAFALAGCGKKVNTTDPNAEGFVFTVGFDATYPPYGYQNEDGEYVGFDLDLAKAVCDLNGWEFACEPIDWDAKDSLLDSETITCIWNGFTCSDERKDAYAWSDLYMHNAQVVVVKAGSDIASLDDLSGKIVATQVKSAALDLLEGDYADLTATFKELQQLEGYDSCFMQLEAGAVDAVACDLSYFDYRNAAKPGAFVNIQTINDESYGVGFKLGNEELAATVTEGMKALDADGMVKELCEKYGIDYAGWLIK